MTTNDSNGRRATQPALLALLVGGTYLAWRSTTGSGVDPLLFWPLLAAEAALYLRFVLRVAVSWRLSPVQLIPARAIRTVDVVVAAYAEPADIVRATLIGCRELRYPHRTWLVDDRNRPELAALAAEFEVGYITRDEADDGRAGALNEALSRTDGEFVMLLDADQVPMPDAIHRTIGYFDDPSVALVQTPLEYQNRDSILHADQNRHERSLTNDVINRGRDRLGAALWEGPAAVLRRSAIDEIGGIIVTGTTGELQTTVRLHGAGWTSRYHSEVIAYGLAAHDLRTLLRERGRWARGHLAAVTTRDNPLWARGLTRGQRLSHTELISDYFASVAHLTIVAVLVASLLGGALPMAANPAFTMFAVVGWVSVNSWARTALGRGAIKRGESALHSALTFQIHLTAILATLIGSRRRFLMSEAPRVDRGGFDVVRQLGLVSLVTLVLEGAIATRLLDTLVGIPLPGRIGGMELIALVGVSSVLLWFLLRVLGVFVSRRQRRSRHREQVNMPGVLDGKPAKILDANSRGVSVITPELISAGAEVRVGVRIVRADGTHADLWFDAVVRSAVPNQHGTRRRLGCQFSRVDQDTQDALVEYLAVVRPFAELRSGTSAHATL